MPDTSPNLRAEKCWQGSDPMIVWQISFRTKNSEGSLKFQKAFLVIDARPSSRGISITLKKPDFLKPQGVIANLVRKHCSSGQITSITHDKNSDDWIVRLEGSEGRVFVFYLDSDKPSTLHFINLNSLTNLARLNIKHSYTKAKEADAAVLQNPDLQDSQMSMIQKLVSSIDGPNDRSESAIESEDHKSNSTTSSASLSSSQHSTQQKQLMGSLKRKHRTIRKHIQKLSQDLPDEAMLKSAEQTAHLVNTYSYLIEDRSESLTIPSDSDENVQSIVIPLDSEKSIGENINSFFLKIKKLYKSRQMKLPLIAEAQISLSQIEADIAKLQEIAQDSISLNQIRKKYNIKSPQISSIPTDGESKKHSKYSSASSIFKSSEGLTILVGKSATLNDTLTKSAKSNDFWLHATNMTGSHVIVPNQKGQATLPKLTLREAGILAIHFSKLRSNQAGEVSYTQKMHVKKRKNLAPGAWLIDRAETIYIKYDEAELQRLLDTKSNS